MIESEKPGSWKDLQNKVSRILNECAIMAETPKKIETVRGKVEVDVFAEDRSVNPNISYICECKNWKSNVPKTVVHSFRTVISDFGANFGIIISCKGFQKGALEASKNTNILLLTWKEFQNMFFEKWYLNFFAPALDKIASPLIEYAEPINSRIDRKAGLLSPDKQKKLYMLKEKYSDLPFELMFMLNPSYTHKLNEHRATGKRKIDLTFGSMKINNFREYLSVMQPQIESITAEFDEIFGERA